MWRKSAPEFFLFSINANRFISHIKKLYNPQCSLEKFLYNVAYIKNSLGFILFQLPLNWNFNLLMFLNFVKYLPSKFKYTLEFQNATWYNLAIYQILTDYNLSCCIYEIDNHM